ncbi:MAG: ROK family protein [Lachnospiraceae bacterium]|jgi:glucokinase-like ROK family protein|nr:ROK family protein [Lachnospiraceae bacterium]
MPYNKSVLAQLNKKIVLEMIKEKGPINKAEIARRADLSIPTVMKITEEFEGRNIIRNVGKGESKGGKRPDLLEFVEDAFYVMGIDIGRHHVKMVIMDMNASLLKSRYFQTAEELICKPEEFIRHVGNVAQKMIESCNLESQKFMGIGIGMPGILDYERGRVIFSPDFNWIDVPMLELLKQQLPYRIILENANKTLAIGEYTYGAAKTAGYVFCINLGYGIGAAIIENGTLLHGKSGTSGEFGHMIMEPDGPLCDCGNRGCLEAVSSGNAIAKKMKQKIREGRKSLIFEEMAPRVKLEAKTVFEAAIRGDELSTEVIQEAVNYLGIAIASCINLLDPDAIILSGGLTKSSALFMDGLLQTVNRYKMKYSGRNVQIEIGELGEYGTAIGAATLLIRQFFENGGQL